jgi:anti-sigma28 factor (negative regulator of flagellin synthesis)
MAIKTKKEMEQQLMEASKQFRSNDKIYKQLSKDKTTLTPKRREQEKTFKRFRDSDLKKIKEIEKQIQDGRYAPEK